MKLSFKIGGGRILPPEFKEPRTPRDDRLMNDYELVTSAYQTVADVLEGLSELDNLSQRKQIIEPREQHLWEKVFGRKVPIPPDDADWGFDYDEEEGKVELVSQDNGIEMSGKGAFDPKTFDTKVEPGKLIQGMGDLEIDRPRSSMSQPDSPHHKLRDQNYTVKVENVSDEQHITLLGRTTHTYSSGDGRISITGPSNTSYKFTNRTTKLIVNEVNQTITMTEFGTPAD